jgi:hypothetical protein
MTTQDFLFQRELYRRAKAAGVEVAFRPEFEEVDSRSDAEKSMDTIRSNYESAYKKKRAKASKQSKVKADSSQQERTALAPSSVGYAGSQYRY